MVLRRCQWRRRFSVPRSSSFCSCTNPPACIFLSRPGAAGLQHLSAPARLALTTRDLAAQLAQVDAVTIATTKKQTSHWRNYIAFLHDIELDANPFLSDLELWAQHRVIGAFAAAYRNGRFNPKHDPSAGPAVGAKSIRAALDAVAATFRANGHPSPIHDPVTFRLAFILQRQLKGYTNTDPGEKPQKAITPRILRELITIRHTTLDEAVSQLTIGAFFFTIIRKGTNPKSSFF
jgi:hypothetical protein